MDYALLKLVHQTAAALSIGGFVLRASASLLGARWVRRAPARIWPHLVDTVLLAAAIGMVVIADYPLDAPWLLAKIVALLVYIGLGTVAIRPRRTRPVRALAAVLAVVVFGYIVAVAFTKDPLVGMGAALA